MQKGELIYIIQLILKTLRNWQKRKFALLYYIFFRKLYFSLCNFLVIFKDFTYLSYIRFTLLTLKDFINLSYIRYTVLTLKDFIYLSYIRYTVLTQDMTPMTTL